MLIKIKYQEIRFLGSDKPRILFLSSPLADKRDIVVTSLVRCMCVRPCIRASVRPCVHASVRICPDHNLYNNAWILKQFGTAVALEEEKCHLIHFR